MVINRFSRIALSAFCILLNTLLLLEIGLRIFLPLRMEPSRELRRVTRQQIPGLRDGAVLEVNELGLRSLSWNTLEKTKNTVRILALGGSTTNEANLDTSDMWSARLEARLKEWFPGEPITLQVGAWGSAGLTIADRLLWAWEHIPTLRPDLVILLEAVNDLSNHGYQGYHFSMESVNQLYEQRVADERRRNSQWSWRCRERLHLCRGLAYAKWNLLKKATSLVPTQVDFREYYERAPTSEHPIRDVDPILEFEQVLERLITYLKNQASEVIVLGQPTLWKPNQAPEEKRVEWHLIASRDGWIRPDSGWAAHEMERYNRVQHKVAMRLGALYIPLDKMVPKTLEYLYDHCHFTIRGSERVAEMITPGVATVVKRLMANRSLAP